MSSEKRDSKSPAPAGSGKKEKDDCSEDDHKKKKSPDDQLSTAESSRVNKKPCTSKNPFSLSSKIAVLAGGNNKLPADPNNPVVHAATDQSEISNNSDQLSKKNISPPVAKQETTMSAFRVKNELVQGSYKAPLKSQETSTHIDSKPGKKRSSQETKEALGLKGKDEKSGQGNDNNSSSANNQAPQKSGVTSQPQPQPQLQPKDTFKENIFPQISGEGNNVSKNTKKNQPPSSGNTTEDGGSSTRDHFATK